MRAQDLPIGPTELELLTLEHSSLAIGRYPSFRYDARGGRGAARVTPSADQGLQSLRFDPERLRIPALDRRSARFLGLPLPAGVAVAITPLLLEGALQPLTGELQLRFQARFQLCLGPWYRAPELWIDTQLSTALVRGRRHQATGLPLNGNGEAVLVGVAAVAPCGEAWLDRFLGLPDEALAVLHCQLRPA
jgi:hypothetical protein